LVLVEIDEVDTVEAFDARGWLPLPQDDPEYWRAVGDVISGLLRDWINTAPPIKS
jgi:hypothetical protein